MLLHPGPLTAENTQTSAVIYLPPVQYERYTRHTYNQVRDTYISIHAYDLYKMKCVRTQYLPRTSTLTQSHYAYFARLLIISRDYELPMTKIKIIKLNETSR